MNLAGRPGRPIDEFLERYPMSNQDNEFEAYNLDVDLESPIDWNEALAELESSSKPAPAPKKQVEAKPEPAPEPAAEKKPAPKPAPKKENKPRDMMGEYERILTAVNKAMNNLRTFKRAHPYLVAPNIFGHWEDSLKETSLMMTREYQRIRRPEEDNGGSR